VRFWWLAPTAAQPWLNVPILPRFATRRWKWLRTFVLRFPPASQFSAFAGALLFGLYRLTIGGAGNTAVQEVVQAALHSICGGTGSRSFTPALCRWRFCQCFQPPHDKNAAAHRLWPARDCSGLSVFGSKLPALDVMFRANAGVCIFSCFCPSLWER